jgi:hypothetical protein
MVRWLATVLIAAGWSWSCYGAPEPACGFICGSDGACPDDYTCHSDDRRCHLTDGSAVSCPSGIDAGADGG